MYCVCVCVCVCSYSDMNDRATLKRCMFNVSMTKSLPVKQDLRGVVPHFYVKDQREL